jgi:hypothetical protein
MVHMAAVLLPCRDGKLADRLEQASQAVKAAYSECPSYDMVRGLLAGWLAGLHAWLEHRQLLRTASNMHCW